MNDVESERKCAREERILSDLGLKREELIYL